MPSELLGVREAIHAALEPSRARRRRDALVDGGPIAGRPRLGRGTRLRGPPSAVLEAPPAAVCARSCGIGGRHGWYAADGLWRLRGRSTGSSAAPACGAVAATPTTGRATATRSTSGGSPRSSPAAASPLRAEMKLPGEASLEFLIQPLSPELAGHSRSGLSQIARFKPKGLLGLAYWYAVLPFHGLVTPRALARHSARGRSRRAALERIRLSRICIVFLVFRLTNEIGLTMLRLVRLNKTSLTQGTAKPHKGDRSMKVTTILLVASLSTGSAALAADRQPADIVDTAVAAGSSRRWPRP